LSGPVKSNIKYGFGSFSIFLKIPLMQI